MRWICCASLACALATAQFAAAVEPQPGVKATPAGHHRVGALCGPACSAPPGYVTQPGCCECQPSCCDNAWATFCAEKAHWKALWQRIGTGTSGCHRGAKPCLPGTAQPCDQGNSAPVSNGTLQSLPSDPTPTPAPPRTAPPPPAPRPAERRT